MSFLTRDDRLREAAVALAEDETAAWLEIIERSGRLKTAQEDLLDRVDLAFGGDNTDAREALVRNLIKDRPSVPDRRDQLAAVLAGAQLAELFQGLSRGQTEASSIDSAALAVRILSRTGRRPVFADLGDAADSWLRERGDLVRVIPKATAPPLDQAASELDFSNALFEANDWEAMRQAQSRLVEGVTAIASAISALERVPRAIQELNRALVIVGEQQQIGWWILSDGPIALDWSWAYEAANQLSELTRVTPGPRAAPELFARKASRGEWDPEPREIAAAVSVPVDARFAPVRLMLSKTALGDLSPARSASDAAMAAYDEILLDRMIQR